MAEPLYTNYPQTLEALRNKYREMGPALSNLPTPIVRSLAQFDLKRVQQGQNPLSARETGQVLQTAVTGQAYTPEPEPSLGQTVMNTLNPFAGRRNPIIDNLATIGSSIPRIPLALARETQQIRDLPDIISQATGQADNPLEAVGNIAMSPGVRFIPGSYVAGNLLGGTEYDEQGKVLAEGSPGELVRNPLFTALDVLPFARGAAKSSKAAQAVEANRAAMVAAGAPLYDIPKLRPIRTALTRQVDELGNVVPNRVGKVTMKAGEVAGRTRIGQLGQEAFGREFGRIPSAIKAGLDVDVAERMNHLSKRRGAGYDDDPLTVWNREARGLNDEFKDLDNAKIRELTKRMKLDDTGSLVGRELEYVNRVKDLVDRSRQFGKDANLTGEAVIAGSPEVYPKHIADKINKSQRMVQHADDVAQYRSRPLDHDPDTLFADLHKPLEDTAISKRRQLMSVRARLYALEQQGFDTKPVRDVINDRKSTIDDVNDAIVDLRTTRPTVQRVMGGADAAEDMSLVVQRLRSLSKADSQVAKLQSAIRDGRWTQAATHLRDIRSRSRNVLDDLSIDSDLLKEAIKRERLADSFIKRTEGEYGDARIAELEAYKTHIERKNVPARFSELVDEGIRERVRAHVEGTGASVITDIDEALRLADENNFGLIPSLDQHTYREIQREVRETWIEMKESGLDPVYIHKVSPAQASQLGFPRVLERELTPSQVREKGVDYTSDVGDATVALEHQGMEWLIKRNSEKFVEEIGTRYGVPERELQQRYLPAARAAAEINPALDVRAYMQELMKKEWTPYNPQEFVTWGPARLKQFGDDLWVPKPLRKNLERMHVPPSGRLTQTMDPIMKVFRTSLLPLSPRWHFYNILGGMVVTALRAGPSAIPLIGEAYRMAKEGTLPEGVMHGYGMVPREQLQWQATASKADKVGAAFHYVGGRKMRELWDSAQGARTGFNNFVQKSYDFNGFFDDFYRSLGFLYGESKAARGGLSEAAAKTEGMLLTRKIMQNWDEITPLERTVMRYVFPFYGWMNHVLRYTMSYPMDHPFRTSIMAQFARNELEDMGTGLPQTFLNMFFVGDVDYDGKVKAINTAGMNPFSDVANYFTLAGFTGNANPVISSVLQTLGVDTGKGAPELYPNLQYDPHTGRMVAKNDSLVMNFAQAVVPQSRILFGASGMSSEWKELLRRNPDSAGRMFASQLGIPIVTKDIGLYEEQFKGELARSDAQLTSVRESLKSGGELRDYPQLSAFMDQIRALQQGGELEGYTPQVERPSMIDVAQRGLLGAVGLG